ncbi:SMP-30/gluconolactonase/LRE family protein [Streptomyces olivoreticuli]
MTPEYTVAVPPGGAILGEGPSWDSASNRLWWLDVILEQLYVYDPQTGANASLPMGTPVGSVMPRLTGGHAVTTDYGIHAITPDGSLGEVLAPLPVTPGTQVNDGKCDPLGRYWTGTMAKDRQSPLASLLRVNTDGTVAHILNGVTVSNGMAWSADNSLMYYIDTRTGFLDVFDYRLTDGSVTDRRHLIDFRDQQGRPNGMTIDAEDHLWVASWGGYAVQRYRPDGTFDKEIVLPAAKITSCCFGGSDLTDLYVTSSRAGLTPAELNDQPLAGALFKLSPGVAGMPTRPFAL